MSVGLAEALRSMVNKNSGLVINIHLPENKESEKEDGVDEDGFVKVAGSSPHVS